MYNLVLEDGASYVSFLLVKNFYLFSELLRKVFFFIYTGHLYTFLWVGVMIGSFMLNFGATTWLTCLLGLKSMEGHGFETIKEGSDWHLNWFRLYYYRLNNVRLEHVREIHKDEKENEKTESYSCSDMTDRMTSYSLGTLSRVCTPVGSGRSGNDWTVERHSVLAESTLVVSDRVYSSWHVVWGPVTLYNLPTNSVIQHLINYTLSLIDYVYDKMWVIWPF